MTTFNATVIQQYVGSSNVGYDGIHGGFAYGDRKHVVPGS